MKSAVESASGIRHIETDEAPARTGMFELQWSGVGISITVKCVTFEQKKVNTTPE